jgi:hypothetical protein
MKEGAKIVHRFNPKACGVIVALVGDDSARVLWTHETQPRLHPLNMLVSIEVAAAIPDAIEPEPADAEGFDLDEPLPDEVGVEELSLESVKDEIEPDVDEDSIGPEIEADEEPEIIGE